MSMSPEILRRMMQQPPKQPQLNNPMARPEDEAVSVIATPPIARPMPPPTQTPITPAELAQQSPGVKAASSVGLGNPRFTPRPPVPPQEGYRAQAQAQLGEQKKRGLGQIFKDIALGFAGGGLGGAIVGGVAGGNLRRENNLNAIGADLREADQVQRQNQIDADQQQRYADQQEQIAREDEARQQDQERRAKLTDLEIQEREKRLNQPNKADTDYDLITGYDDEGNARFYKKTANGLELVKGINAPLPKTEKTRIPEGQIKAEAQAKALQILKQRYPQGFDNPQWQGLLDMAGYDRTKPANDPANVAVVQGMRYKFPNIKDKLDPTETPEFQEILAQTTADTYKQYEQQSRPGANQSTSPAQAPTKVPQRRYSEADLEKYKQFRNNPEARQLFKNTFGQDPEALLNSARPVEGSKDIIPSPTPSSSQMPKAPPAPAKSKPSPKKASKASMGDVQERADKRYQTPPAPQAKPATAPAPQAKATQEQINREFYNLTKSLIGNYPGVPEKRAKIKAELMAKYGIEPQEIAPLTNTYYDVRDALNLGRNIPQGPYAGR